MNVNEPLRVIEVNANGRRRDLVLNPPENFWKWLVKALWRGLLRIL